MTTTDSDRLPQTRNQIILVFQGGGALGSYQAGVYQALHEAGIEPDWIIGTSIGAINASIIAGNSHANRIDRLQEFWTAVESPKVFGVGSAAIEGLLSNWRTVLCGIPAFFEPMLGMSWLTGAAESSSFYSTAPLRRTLSKLVDFDHVVRHGPRLTVGAANVRTSEMRYFDSRATRLSVDHVLASGALPPAFPPVRIEGELYWDGGILSNSPTEIVFEDNPRRDAVIFAVNVWNPMGDEPHSIVDAMHRHKDIQFSSRLANHIEQHKKAHRLRHVISEIERRLPKEIREDVDVRALAAFGCRTRMHVVQLLNPRHHDDGVVKDVDFTHVGIRRRWDAGYAHTMRALRDRPWEIEQDGLDGVILHDFGPE